MNQLPERIRQKIMPEPNSGCWLWMGTWKNGTHNYGQVQWEKKTSQAHRVVYMLLRGRIPVGLEIDHLCRNPACVNPDHLEPVTHAENNRRGRSHNGEKTECPAGHPYNAANTYIDRHGSRICRPCRNRRQQEYMQRREKRV